MSKVQKAADAVQETLEAELGLTSDAVGFSTVAVGAVQGLITFVVSHTPEGKEEASLDVLTQMFAEKTQLALKLIKGGK